MQEPSKATLIILHHGLASSTGTARLTGLVQAILTTAKWLRLDIAEPGAGAPAPIKSS